MPVTPPAPPLRSQDLVFTLFGDCLLDREPVRVSSLITLLGELGLSATGARTVLSRMTRKGWLTVDRADGRSRYGLTKRGRALLESGRERIYHPPRARTWDGAWYLITYSIPESHRHRRDELRVKLLWLGCGLLTNGVWITPHDVRADVQAIAGSLHVSRHLEVFRAEHVGFSSTDQLVGACWDLAGINRRYAAFLARWSPALSHCATCRLAGDRAGAGAPTPPCLSARDCFVRRFRLVHEFRQFPLLDPFLPTPLLPADWKGDAAAVLFETYHAVLSEAAERYVTGVCEAGSTEAAPAA
jgi:phenylacetic acid degradation operon negative regulatory protein